jgi:uncharacterized protein YbaR (Trm112 family)
MDKTILYLLACPLCKGELLFVPAQEELICRFDRLGFPIHDNVPIMVESRARRLSIDEMGNLP